MVTREGHRPRFLALLGTKGDGCDAVGTTTQYAPITRKPLIPIAPITSRVLDGVGTSGRVKHGMTNRAALTVSTGCTLRR